MKPPSFNIYGQELNPEKGRRKREIKLPKVFNMSFLPHEEHANYLDPTSGDKANIMQRHVKVCEEDSSANTAILEIRNYPKFNGIKYSYGAVSLGDGEGEELKVRFSYDIFETPVTTDIEAFSENDMNEFDTLLGDILVSFVLTKGKESWN